MNMLKTIKKYSLPILLGVATFFLVVGPKPLDPSNINWLAGWDPSQEYFGWAIFRNGPWLFPIGLNPNYGMEFSSSIVYSDSLPILALLFKLLSPILPNTFQYLGLWNLTCFILQAIFAWKLISLFTKERWLLFFATGLFIFAPPFLWKVNSSNSLISQFLIIWALYLIFKPKTSKNFYWWLLLLIFAEAIHFYIFVMVFVLWISNLLDELFFHKSTTLKIVAKEFLFSLLWIFIVGWQVGYFEVGTSSTATGNYGLGATNVLALFDANGWSYLLGDIRQTPFNYGQENIILNKIEGFNYLGLGLIIALIAALATFLIKPSFPLYVFKKYLFFILALFGLSALAISNQVSIGPYNFSFELPASIINFASMFRASGRMFWPIFYTIVFLFILLVIKTYPKRFAIPLLAICFIIQAIDTSAGWLPVRNQMNTTSGLAFKTPLINPFWKLVGKHYQNIVRVPAKNNLYDWTIFANYSVQYALATNSVFLARVDERKLVLANDQFSQLIQSGKYNSETLYIFENSQILPVLMHLNKQRDLFIQVDGFNVLAPGWKQCGICESHSLQGVSEIASEVPIIDGKQAILFSTQSNPHNLFFLAGGWGNPESWGSWSTGPVSKLLFPPPLSRFKTLTLELRALVSEKYPKQVVEIIVNQIPQAVQVLSKGDKNFLKIAIPEKIGPNDYLSIELKLPNAARPVDLGITRDDERLLALGIVAAEFD